MGACSQLEVITGQKEEVQKQLQAARSELASVQQQLAASVAAQSTMQKQLEQAMEDLLEAELQTSLATQVWACQMLRSASVRFCSVLSILPSAGCP